MSTRTNSVICSALLSSLILTCTSAMGQQRLEMEGTAIIGNKELPKVLYIVPWKSSQPVALDTPSFISVLDEAFQPVERDSYQRQVKFYNDLYAAPVANPEPVKQ